MLAAMQISFALGFMWFWIRQEWRVCFFVIIASARIDVAHITRLHFGVESRASYTRLTFAQFYGYNFETLHLPYQYNVH